jgi:hypothetical protein
MISMFWIQNFLHSHNLPKTSDKVKSYGVYKMDFNGHKLYNFLGWICKKHWFVTYEHKKCNLHQLYWWYGSSDLHSINLRYNNWIKPAIWNMQQLQYITKPEVYANHAMEINHSQLVLKRQMTEKFSYWSCHYTRFCSFSLIIQRCIHIATKNKNSVQHVNDIALIYFLKFQIHK